MSHPGDLLLNRLINTYQAQHELYRTSRADLRIWGFLVGLTALVAPVFYLVFRPTDWTTAIFILAIGIAAILSLLWKIAKARKELLRLKAELESVGLRIACNQEEPSFPRLEILREDTGNPCHVLLPAWINQKLRSGRKIYFEKYDELFRI
jgi:hypothetical protein